jgi:hypothetical protein
VDSCELRIFDELYRVDFWVFCPNKTFSTLGLSNSGEVFILLASASAAIFAAPWVAKPPPRFGTPSSGLRIS